MITTKAIWAVVLAIFGTTNLFIVLDELIGSRMHETRVHVGMVMLNIIASMLCYIACSQELNYIRNEEKCLREELSKTEAFQPDTTSNELPPETYDITNI